MVLVMSMAMKKAMMLMRPTNDVEDDMLTVLIMCGDGSG